jgi:hypothetical protein
MNVMWRNPRETTLLMRLSSATCSLTDVSEPEASTHRVEPSTTSVRNKTVAWSCPSLTVETLFWGPSHLPCTK